jgi:hypothetical protein
MRRAKDSKPNAAEYNKLRNLLSDRGAKSSDLDDLLGTGANKRNRGDVADSLRAWCRGLKKG